METPNRQFRLIRHYAYASFVSIAIAAAILGFEFRRITIEELKTSSEANNIALTQSLANALWHQLSPLLTTRGKAGKHDIDIEAIHQAVARQVGNLAVVKVKLYNLSGRTVFSTELKQIGDDMSANPGFQVARSGRIASELIHQDSFSYFDREIIRDRDLLSSYVPLRKHDGTGAIEAVFEVYSDITADLRHLRQSQLHMIAITTSVLAALYFALFFLVRHADRTIMSQSARQQELQDKVSHMSKYDLLTQLANRSELLRHLNEVLEHGAGIQSRLALTIVVVDNLKQINDTHGHITGDRTLCETARRLRSLLGDGVFLSYYSDGKYAVVFEDAEDANQSFVRARQMLEFFQQPISIAGGKIGIALSIGIALYPKDGKSADLLIRQALAAAHQAHLVGPNHIRFYHPRSSEAAESGKYDGSTEIAPA